MFRFIHIYIILLLTLQYLFYYDIKKPDLFNNNFDHKILKRFRLKKRSKNHKRSHIHAKGYGSIKTWAKDKGLSIAKGTSSGENYAGA